MTQAFNLKYQYTPLSEKDLHMPRIQGSLHDNHSALAPLAMFTSIEKCLANNIN